MMNCKLLHSMLAVALLTISSAHAGWFDEENLESIGKKVGQEVGKEVLIEFLKGKKITPPGSNPAGTPQNQPGAANAALTNNNKIDYASAPEPFHSLALNVPDGVFPIQVPLLEGALNLNAIGNPRATGLALGASNDTARFFSLLALKLETRLFDQNPYHYAQAHLRVPEKRRFLAVHEAVSDNADLQSSIYTGGGLARWKDSEFEPGVARREFVSSGYKEKLLAYAPSLPFRMIATYGLRLGEYSNGAFPFVFLDERFKPAKAGQIARSPIEDIMGGLQLSNSRMQDPDTRCAEKDSACQKNKASETQYLLSFEKLGDPMPEKLPMNIEQARSLAASMGWGAKEPRNVFLVMEISVDGVRTNPTKPNEKVLTTHVTRVELYGDQARTRLIHTFVGGNRRAESDRQPSAGKDSLEGGGHTGIQVSNSARPQVTGHADVTYENWCDGLKAIIATADETEPFQSIKIQSSCKEPGVPGYQNCIVKTEQFLPRIGGYAVANNTRCTLDRSLVNHPTDSEALMSKLSCRLTLEGNQQAGAVMKQLRTDIQACIGVKPRNDSYDLRYDWGNKSLYVRLPGNYEPGATLVLGAAYGKNVTTDGKYCDPRLSGRAKDRCRDALRYL